MASSKRMTRYCKLFNWVKDENPEFAQALDDLCLVKNLSTFRDYGLSFVMPTKKVVKEIIDHTYGSNPEKAYDLVNAHIILANLDDSTKETSNKLGYKISVNGKGKEVHLDKLKVKRSESFKPMTGKNISAWLAEEGEPTMTGTKIERGAMKPKAKKGSSEQLRDTTYNARQRILTDIKNHYVNALIDSARGVQGSSPHAEAARAVASVVGQIELRAKGGCESCGDASHVISSVIDDNPTVTALILFNPNQQIAETMVKAFNVLGDKISAKVADASDYKKILSKKKSENSNAAHAVHSLRKKINALKEESGTANGHATSVILGAYNDLYSNNKIGDVEGIFPEKTAAIFKRTGGSAALLRDIMRNDVATSLQAIDEETFPVSAADLEMEVDSVFSRAKSVYGGQDSGSVNKGLYMFNSERTKFVRGEGEAEHVSDVMKMSFVNSSDFLYHPSSASVVGASEYFYDRRAHQAFSGGHDDDDAENLRAEIKGLLN